MNHAPAHRSCFAGLGCRRGCNLDGLRRLLDRALAQSGVARADLAGLATIEAKRDEPVLQRLARELGIELQAWSAADLRRFEHQLSVRSARTYALFGCYGIAEPAALASAARGDAGGDVRLVGTRMGDRMATIALACRTSAPLD